MRHFLSGPCAEAATLESLRVMAGQLGCELPDDYVAFMLETNGYTGGVGKMGFVNIWCAEQVFPTNRANNFKEWIPGLVLFGANEGSEFYAFDMRRNPPGVVMVPMIPLDLASAVDVGASFTDFMEGLARGRDLA